MPDETPIFKVFTWILQASLTEEFAVCVQQLFHHCHSHNRFSYFACLTSALLQTCPMSSGLHTHCFQEWICQAEKQAYLAFSSSSLSSLSSSLPVGGHMSGSIWFLVLLSVTKSNKHFRRHTVQTVLSLDYFPPESLYI